MVQHLKKIYLLIIALSFSLITFGQSYQYKISTQLQNALDETDNDEWKEITILLSDRVDAEALRKQFDADNTSLEERTETTIRLLKQKAITTQTNLIETIDNQFPTYVDLNTIEQYWIVNLIKIKVSNQNAITQLSQLPQVDYLDLNSTIFLEEFTTDAICEVEEGITVVDGIEPGLAAINAPAMWALGYTGHGTKALSIDTGVDPTHPAFDYKYEGLFSSSAEAWFDYNNQTIVPNDCNGHGTHTVGTMLGLDRANNDTIGVAFGATWMGSQAICGSAGGASADNMASFQWAIDPDGDSTTIDDMPTVICNSWYDPGADATQCGGAYQNLFDAVEAVGIAVVFSAGNDGPAAVTITPPKNVNNDLVSVFCVGALSVNGSNISIANFSSRGPSICGDTGSYLIKPEVSAPGDYVRSADLGGIYSFKSGTSMAAPHVSGAILLLKEAFPMLTGRQMKLALYYSAVDMGPVGEDNTYGMGAIDVFAAYQYLINQGHTPIDPSVSRDIASQNLMLEEIICNPALTIAPSIEIVNVASDTVYNVIIRYTISNGLTDTIQWSGVLAKGDVALVQVNPITLAGGYYDFEIFPESVNGLQDERVLNNRLSQSFLLTASEYVTTQDATVCSGADALLYASHPSGNGEIRWYPQAVLGQVVGIGNSLTIPNLTNDITYFADIVNSTVTGITDNTIGNGSQSNDLSGYLEFDCFTPFILKTVKVYTTQTGGRKIVLRDEMGNVIAQKLLSISQTGENTITLNWRIARGQNLQLGVELASNYHMTTSGVNYPYVVQDVVTIKNSHLGQGVYPFFYDWQIDYGSPCGRVTATALVGNGSVTADFLSDVDSLDLSLTNGEVSFTDVSQNAVSWFWDFGDGNTSTLPNPIHTYTYPGDYQVSLQSTSSTGCSDAFTQNITILNYPVLTNGIDILNNNIRIYPNPTSNILNIELNLDKTTDVEFQLFDAVGQLILNQKTVNYTTQKTILNLNDLPSGIYFLQIRMDGNLISRKVIRY